MIYNFDEGTFDAGETDMIPGHGEETVEECSFIGHLLRIIFIFKFYFLPHFFAATCSNR